MASADIVSQTASLLVLVLYLSLPSILVAALAGTLFSLFQALTQIQEQTLSFAVKLIAVVATIWLTATSMGEEIYQYTQNVFQMIGTIR